MGKYERRFEPAYHPWIGFKELVRPGPLLLAKYAAIDSLLLLDSRAVKFRKLSIRKFRVWPFLVLQFANRVERLTVREFEIRRYASISVGCGDLRSRNLVRRRWIFVCFGLV